MRALRLGLGLGLALSAPAIAGAQQKTVRFEITAVGDTTLAFRTGTATWVARGQAGTAVDPRRRDQLVARFRVIAVRDGLATALVTGQVTAVSTDHVATIEPPRRPWFRTGTFWSGVLLGGALGATAALTR